MKYMNVVHHIVITSTIIGGLFAVVAATTSFPLLAHAAGVCYDIKKDVELGQRDLSDKRVTALQGFLIEKGYLKVKATGYFGPATQAAVKSFQRANGVKATGYIGPLSRAKIRALSCGATASASPAVSTVSKDSVLRSINGGESFETYFQVSTSNKMDVADVLSISFDPRMKDRVVVTTYDDGIFTNAGRINKWQSMVFPYQKIYSFVLDQKNLSQPIFASGVVDNNGRIFRTIDAGQTWKVAYAEPGSGTYVSALAQHPLTAGVMLAGTSGGTAVKSLDGGLTWKNVGQKISGIISQFGFDSTKEPFVYLLSAKLYHSTNAGSDWLDWEQEKTKEVQALRDRARTLTTNKDTIGAKQLNDQADALVKRNTLNKTPSGILHITADPRQSGTVYAGTNNGLYRSVDFGKYWDKLNIIESASLFPIPSIAINPKDSNEIVFVAGKSLYKSTNRGDTWATVPLDNKRKAAFVAYDPFDSKVLFVGVSAR